MAPVCEDGGFFYLDNLFNLERMCIFVLEEINSKILSHEKIVIFLLLTLFVNTLMYSQISWYNLKGKKLTLCQ